MGNIPKSAVISIPRKGIAVSEFTFDDKHINGERSHFVDRPTAEAWIDTNKISINVWNGNFERYYGTDGAVYVDLETKNIRTAFSAREFDEKNNSNVGGVKEVWILSTLLVARLWVVSI